MVCDDLNFGHFRVIKTRENYVVEANVSFDIEKEVSCDDNYEFPEDQMLILGDAKFFKNLKGIFKAKSKQEVLNISFVQDCIYFKGEVNRDLTYEINPKILTNYLYYLSSEEEHQKSRNFTISVSLRHILSLLKICDLIEGNVRRESAPTIHS